MRLPNKLIPETGIALLLSLAVVVILGTVTLYSVVVQTQVPDQSVHRQIAEAMYRTGTLSTPHFFYQILVIVAHVLVQDSGWLLSSFIANLIPQLFVTVLLYLGLRSCFWDSIWEQEHIWIVRFVCAGLALGLLVFTPVFPLLQPFGNGVNPMLLGYVNPTTYHNPTIIALRPLALALFLSINAYIINYSKHYLASPRLEVILLAILTILCGLGKPNYLIALLPALVLWLIWQRWRNQSIAWQRALLGVLIPAVLFLGWQYYFTYINPTGQLEGSRIVFAPFREVLALSGGSRLTMILRFIVSALFPAAVYVSYRRQAWRSASLNFCWLTFLFGASFMYLLQELGSRIYNGNFFWSAYITLFLLNFESARFLLKQWSAERVSRRIVLSYRSAICFLVLMLHVLSGVIYIQYVINLQLAFT